MRIIKSVGFLRLLTKYRIIFNQSLFIGPLRIKSTERNKLKDFISVALRVYFMVE